jgi:hypothetical protein
VQTGEPPKKGAPEKTRARKKKSEPLVNADPKLIDDLIRIDELSLATLQSRLVQPSSVCSEPSLAPGGNAMRFFVASLIVVAALYFWDKDYNNGRLFEGLDSMRRSVSHSMFH